MSKFQFGTEDVSLCWGAFAGKRSKFDIIREYYEGRRFPDSQKVLRYDKHIKSKIPDGYTRYVTDFHTGYMTSNAVEYAGGADADAQAIDEYKNVLACNGSELLDAEHYRQAFLYGYSLELVYLDQNGNIRIEAGDPSRWAFVQDDFGIIQIAIRRQTIPESSMYRGRYVRTSFDVFEVFTSDSHIVYDAQSMRKIVREKHNLGFCPVHKISLNKACKPSLKDNFYLSCDQLCKTIGNLSDMISWNINSLFCVKTTSELMTSMMQTDETGNTNYAKMLQQGTIFLPPGSDATYLSRDVSVSHFIEDLREQRLRICQAGSVPDLESLIRDGKITGLSGTALQTLFYPTQVFAERTEPYLVKSLKKRLDIVNAIQKHIGKCYITCPEKIIVSCRKRMPLSIEAIQNIGNLQSVLGREDILRTVPQIDNVAAALSREPMIKPAPDTPTTPDTPTLLLG